MKLVANSAEFISGSSAKIPNVVKLAIEELDELAQLGENWDSYGAYSPSKRSLVGACQLINELLDKDTPKPDIFPVPNGNVQIEWSCSGIELEIEVISSTNCEVYYNNTDEVWEKTFSFDLEELRNVVAKLSDNESPLSLVV